MSGILKWILGHATEVGLVLGGIGGVTGLVYLYDFLSTRRKQRKKNPVVIPPDLDNRRDRSDIERYGDEWTKKLDSAVTDLKGKR